MSVSAEFFAPTDALEQTSQFVEQQHPSALRERYYGHSDSVFCDVEKLAPAVELLDLSRRQLKLPSRADQLRGAGRLAIDLPDLIEAAEYTDTFELLASLTEGLFEEARPQSGRSLDVRILLADTGLRALRQIFVDQYSPDRAEAAGVLASRYERCKVILPDFFYGSSTASRQLDVSWTDPQIASRDANELNVINLHTSTAQSINDARLPQSIRELIDASTQNTNQRSDKQNGTTSDQIIEDGLQLVEPLAIEARQTQEQHSFSTLSTEVGAHNDRDTQPIEQFVAMYLDSDYEKPIELLSNIRGGREYLQQIGALLRSSVNLELLAPPALSSQAVEAARKIIAEATYSAQQLLYRGKYQAFSGYQTPEFRLANGRQISFESVGLKARGNLRNLNASLEAIETYMESDDVRSVLAVDGNGFRIWRFIDPSGVLPPAAYAYLRPYGATNYDTTYEHGRPGQGVEASLNFVYDPYAAYSWQAGNRAAVPIQRGTQGYDSRISIRLDREGAAPNDRNHATGTFDPIQEQGTVSLDMGSLKGYSLSADVGRVLALGSYTRQLVHGTPSELNHRTEPFSAEFGQADVFAAAVVALDRQLQGRRATSAEVSAFKKMVTRR